MQVILFLGLVASALSGPPKSTPPNASFHPENGGEFGITTDKGVWMALQWATVAEVNSAGQTINLVDLSVHHFVWSQPILGDLLDDRKRPTGDRYPGVSFTERLENGAWFNVSAWIIDLDANHSSAKHNTLKFSIYISNWTFAAASDSLVLTAGLVGFGGFVRRDEVRDQKSQNVTSSTGVYGSGFLSAPAQALYDGVTNGSVTVQHTQGEGKPVVIFTFGSFSANVSYDPSMGVGSGNPNSGNYMNPSFLVCLLLFFAVIKQL